MAFKKKPTLVMFCGLPGSGKTTLGRHLEAETGAIRICTDEWMDDLGFDHFDEPLRNKVEQRIWNFGKNLLRLGYDVILENGLWSRQEREDLLRQANEIGALTEMHYFNVPFEELCCRLEIRNKLGGFGIVPITREQMESYVPLFQPPTEEELALYDCSVTH